MKLINLLKVMFPAVMMMVGSVSVWGQITIYSENFGNPAAATNVNSFTGWSNQSVTYTGDGTCTIAQQSGSSSTTTDYSAASAGGSVLLNNTTKWITISGINTLGYTNIILNFGYRKGTGNGSANVIVAEYSTNNGETYTSIAVPNTSTSRWYYYTSSADLLPAVANLTLRFRISTGTNDNRIDDILITGTSAPSCDAPTLDETIAEKETPKTPNTVYLLSSFSDLGTCEVEYGFAYSITNEEPTIDDLTIAGSELFDDDYFDAELELDGLICGNTYYVRSYAKYSLSQVVYGNVETFEADECSTTAYTITLNAGNGTIDNQPFVIIEDVTSAVNLLDYLAEPSAACVVEGWEFAGWSTQENNTDDSKIVSNSYTPTGENTEITLYAVYKKTEEGSILFTDNFNNLTAASAFTSRDGYESISGCYGTQNGILRLATGSAAGSITISAIPSIVGTQNLTLTFKAMRWNTDANGLSLSISGDGTFSETPSFSLGSSGTNTTTPTFSDSDVYSVSIIGATSSTKITFSTITNRRVFIDDIVLSIDDIIIYNSNPVCVPCTAPILDETISVDETQNSIPLLSSLFNWDSYDCAITEFGFAYSSTNENPTIDDSFETSETFDGKHFDAELTGLTCGTAYYVRPYIKYGMNQVVYGTAETFETLACPVVTFNYGTGIVGILSKSGTSIELPTASPSTQCDNNNYEFAGWVEEADKPITPTMDIPAFVTNPYIPTSDAVTLYAVYKKQSSATYDLVTNANQLETGTYLIGTLYPTSGGEYYFFDGTGIVTTGTSHSGGVSSGSNSAQFSALPADALELSFISTGTAGQYYIKTDATNYLGISAASSGNLRIGTTYTYWTITYSGSTLSLLAYSGVTNARLRGFNGTSFRSYGADNGQAVVLFKKNAIYTYDSNPICLVAESNNEDYGTVSLSNDIITASPASCYRYANPAFEVTAGEATVEQAGDEFTVLNHTANTTIIINFEKIPALTLSDRGEIPLENVCSTDIILPEPKNICLGWTFVGWAKSSVEETPEVPAQLYSAGYAYTPATDETLYAVYRKFTAGEDVDVSLTQAEIQASINGGTYSNRFVNSNSGRWTGLMIINTATGYLQINSTGTAGSHILSPTFGGIVKSVAITTANNTLANTTLLITDAANATTPLITSAGVLDYHITTEANEKVVFENFENYEPNFKIFSRTNAAYISKIDVTYTGSFTYNSNPYCYTLIAEPNNEFGEVILPDNSNVVTAMPALCYRYATPAFTVEPEGAAIITQNGNDFTVSNVTDDITVIINFEEIPTYKVRFNNEGELCNELERQSECGAVTLPTISPVCAGWVLAGWAENAETPVTLYYAGSKYYPAEDNVTLYAVYKKVETPTYNFSNVSDESNLKFVVAAKVGSDYYALPNNFTTIPSGAIIDGRIIPVITEGSNIYAASDNTADYEWIITQTGSGDYTIYNGTTYLMNTSSTFLALGESYNWMIAINNLHGTYKITSVAQPTRNLVFRVNTASSRNTFGAYVANADGTEYFNIELLPIGAVIKPNTYIIDENCDIYYRTINNGNWSNENIWQVSQDGSENSWQQATTAPDGGDKFVNIIHEVTLNQTASVQRVEIQAGGELVNNSNLTINGDLMLYKANGDASSVEDDGTMTINGKVKVTVTFENPDLWNHVSFPFNIAEVRKQNGSLAVHNADYWTATYNISVRANQNKHQWDYTGGIVANEPCIIWSEETLIFEAAEVPDFSTAAINNHDKWSDYVKDITNRIEDYNGGWSQVVYPAFSKSAKKELFEGQVVYKYAYPADNYETENDDIVANNNYTFGSYFVKIAKESSVIMNERYPHKYSHSHDNETRARAMSNENIVVKLKGSNGYDYRTKIRVRPEATTGYDSFYDAYHFMAQIATTPQIYSLIFESKIAINAVPEQSTVPIGIRVPTAGEYTIYWENNITEQNAIFYDQNVEIDMSTQSEYTFTTTQTGEINNRFYISFTEKDEPKVITPQYKDDNIVVYTTAGNIIVEGLNIGDAVKMFDITGRILYAKQATTASVQLQAPVKGVYLLNINNDKTIKVIFQ